LLGQGRCVGRAGRNQLYRRREGLTIRDDWKKIKKSITNIIEATMRGKIRQAKTELT